MGLQDLQTVPDGVTRAGAFLAELDRCFLVGFGRLGPEQSAALQALARIFAGTPLGVPVTAACDAVGRNEFVDRHFAALACARAAVQGSMYDALHTQATDALGRSAPPAAGPPAVVAPAKGPIQTWQESTRNWLMELALAGFQQLDQQTLAPFTATLEQLQGEPRATRLAAVLTGFLHEVLQALPLSGKDEVPVYRWADLWTRSMLAALRLPEPPAGTKVSGPLSPLGVDLQHHGFFVHVVVYGLLEVAKETRLVRVPFSSYKVDVVLRDELWMCLPKSTQPLLKGISQRVALRVEEMTLLPTGDLLWDGRATSLKGFLPFSLAQRHFAPGQDGPALHTLSPADRHPIQLAEPVYLEGYTVEAGDDPYLEMGGAKLPLAMARHSPASEMTADEVMKSQTMIGLLRFDGGRWAVQPLAVTLGKKGEAFTGSGSLEAVGKRKDVTLATLQERASRLLRAKA